MQPEPQPRHQQHYQGQNYGPRMQPPHHQQQPKRRSPQQQQQFDPFGMSRSGFFGPSNNMWGFFWLILLPIFTNILALLFIYFKIIKNHHHTKYIKLALSHTADELLARFYLFPFWWFICFILVAYLMNLPRLSMATASHTCLSLSLLSTINGICSSFLSISYFDLWSPAVIFWVRY